MLLDFAVVTTDGEECVEHICGGGAALARSRAAKAALDLVRRGRLTRLDAGSLVR